MKKAAAILGCLLLLVLCGMGCSEGEEGLVNITPGEETTDTDPSWSPDGRQIAFNSAVNEPDESGPLGLYVLDADGQNLRLVSRSGWLYSWTPDGGSLVIAADHGIATIGLDGKNLKYLTRAEHEDEELWGASDASFSPDGTRIVFTLPALNTRPQIFVANADGSDPAMVGRSDMDGIGPRWSPDGSRILFSCGNINPLGWDIYVMNADGSNVVRLTDRPESDGCAEWSPDGQRIAFISDVDGQAEVFVMNSDGSDVARLTDNSIYEESLELVTGRHNSGHRWLPPG